MMKKRFCSSEGFIEMTVTSADKNNCSAFWLRYRIGFAEKACAKISLQSASYVKRFTRELGKIYGRRDQNIVTVLYIFINCGHFVVYRTPVMIPAIATVNARRNICGICIHKHIIAVVMLQKLVNKARSISVFPR